MKFFAFLLFPSLVFCKIEMGEENFPITDKNKSQFDYNVARTLYEHTNVSVYVPCEKGSVTLDYRVVQVFCFNGSSQEITKRPKNLSTMQCQSHVENFNLDPNFFEETGAYDIFIFLNFTPGQVNQVSIRFGVPNNYLSPKDFPLYVFYSIMCVVYSIYALLWLVLCCCYWRELLRVQFWIGGVILLGMLEKAMFVGEYDAVKRVGSTTGAMLIAAEVVSSLKRTLSRMLVIIVSLGFGIVKPRLGTSLHKVTIVGLVFFVVSVADGIIRADDEAYSDKVINTLRLLLSITDAVIFLWILVKTISLLTLRMNVVKLTLYRHFRNVLIFSVLASVAFMLGFFIRNRFYTENCKWSWDEEWWEDAFWRFLFSIILFAIIILWRPSANNQRYAYSPLHDVDEDDLEQLTECTNEGLGVSKTKKGKENFDNNQKRSTNNEDDDLRWVEENIPKSIIDSTLSGLVESDEEINQKKMEISKML